MFCDVREVLSTFNFREKQSLLNKFPYFKTKEVKLTLVIRVKRILLIIQYQFFVRLKQNEYTKKMSVHKLNVVLKDRNLPIGLNNFSFGDREGIQLKPTC